MLGFTIWNIDPELFALGPLHVRYYGLMFGIGFYIGYKIMLDIVKRENLPEEWVEKLFIYTILGTVIGARLGHCLFYQPEYYLSNPIEIFKIWEGGLASHGGAIGVLMALFLYSKKITKRSMLWVMDRIVIGIAITITLIRFGNLMNSEIYGYPTNSNYGFVYAKDTRLAHQLEDGELAKFVDNISIEKTKGESRDGGKSWPVNLNILFKPSVTNEKQVDAVASYSIKMALGKYVKSDGAESNIFAEPDAPVQIKMYKGAYMASIPAFVIPKHPTHIYESLCYFFAFLILAFMYYKTNLSSKQGLLFGVFLVFAFTSRFLIEFLKENQVEFESSMTLNMGQWLSIPFIIVGIVLIIRPYLLNQTSEN